MKRVVAAIVCLLVAAQVWGQVKNAGCTLRLIEPETTAEDLTWENDTVKVKFEFNAMNYFVCVNVWNKTQETISVDWDKFLIIEGNTSCSIIFDDTVMLLKDQPKGSSSIAPGTMIWKNVTDPSNVEYNLELYRKKDIKKYGNKRIGFVVPVVSGVNTTEYRFTVEISL